MQDFEQNQETEYIREKMKERPVNRKKLMRRTVITATMAVIFGVFACFTFLVLEPVFSNFLYPEEEPSQVEIPQDTNEMLPEDMIVEENKEEQASEVNTEDTKEGQVLADYQTLYQQIYELSKTAKKGMVTVTGVSQDMDWFNNPYESKGQTSGIIIANNGKELLILADRSILENAEDIHITFCNSEVVSATVKQTDSNTQTVVLAVSVEKIKKDTLDQIETVTLGNSKQSNLLSMPVIALGRPYGNTESVAYGMITSKDSVLNLTDYNYELLTTDIYGSEDATGILLNFSGEVIGIIHQQHNRDDMKNLVSAIGISELKNTIERMSNGKELAYLGINGTDVTQDAVMTLNVPLGAYVTGIVMDSPAMKAGIQSGDVITGLNDDSVESFTQYTELLSKYSPEDTVSVHLKRQGQNEYREITIPVILGKLK